MNTEKLQSILNEWVLNQDDPILNLKLAEEYRQLDQPSAAFSHYMKVVESTNEVEVKYYSIMSIAEIYWTLGDRWDGVMRHCRFAKAEQPDRPEAYYLLAEIMRDKLDRSEVTEQYGWDQVYENSRIGLMYAEAGMDRPISKFYLGIDGLKGLYAISMLKLNLLDDLKKWLSNEDFSNSIPYVQNQILWVYNELRIPCPFMVLNKSDKFAFEIDNNLDKINHNYSQAMQDLFVLTMLNGKSNGTYVEIGSADPIYGNNTKLLEELDWKGLSIDFDQGFVNEFNKVRKNPALCSDAFNVDYSKEFKRLFGDSTVIDYLQLDIDPANNTYQMLYHLPFDDYRFRCITFEHDYYNNNAQIRQLAREFFLRMGYICVAPDVKYNNIFSFEDWFVDPNLVNNPLMNQFIDRYSDNRDKLIKRTFVI